MTIDKLPVPMKDHFVPSLVVFIIGAAFLASLQAMVGARLSYAQQSKNTGQLLPGWAFWLFMALNGLWFGAFIIFNVCRGSI